MSADTKNKFYRGTVTDHDNTHGWFFGQFMGEKGYPLLESEKVEVGWKSLPKGFTSHKHYHKVGTEINIVVAGSCVVRINDSIIELSKGDFLVVYPEATEEGIDSENGAEIIVVKAPSVANDKYEI